MRWELKGTRKNQGNIKQNFWEFVSFIEANLEEHLHLFLGNKGDSLIFHREQGKMHTPAPPPHPP